MLRPLLIFLCLYPFLQATAQTHRTDSLRAALYKTTNSSQKLHTLLLLCEEHQNLQRDSAYHYATLARIIASETGDERSLSLASLALSCSYLKWGWTDSALASIEPELKKYSVNKHSDRDLYFRLARQKALSYGARADYKAALEILYGIVHAAEKYKDSLTAGANMNTIASIAIVRNEWPEAVKWSEQAQSFSPSRNVYVPNLAAIHINMANIYLQTNLADSALIYIQKALDECRQAENLNTLAHALRIQSNIYLKKRNIAQAEQSLIDMFEVRRKTAHENIFVDENFQLIDFYIQTEQFEKAIAFCQKNLIRGNAYANNEDEETTFTNNIHHRVLFYEALARCYKATGNNVLYMQTMEHLVAAKDSSYEAASEEAIAEIQTKYEVQKKENTIIQQKLDITRKNYILYGSMILSVLIAVIAWMTFRNYSRKQRLKLRLMQEEEKRNALEAVKNAEEKERVRIAADLHDNLGAYAASISSNLEYIHLPETDTSSIQALHELKHNAKSIVSQLSDTIWALNKESLSLTAISDRIKLFVQRIAPSYPSVSMEVKEYIQNDMSLPPSQAFHLFQIVKEAITNALKHSHAKNIQVILDSNPGWSITITDNGKGMESSDKPGYKSDGNGLLNMKNRAAESGWEIQWLAMAPSGTVVTITPTTN